MGDYDFSEYLPPNINRFYSISVVRKNNAYIASINLDGFQTLKRLEARVTGDEKGNEFKFEKYLPENIFESYKVGETLLRFEKKDSNIITYWGAIDPFDENNKSGNVLFEKVVRKNGQSLSSSPSK